MTLLRLFHQYGDAGLQIRRLDCHRQAPTKAGFQPLLNPLDLLGITITGEDHLLTTFQKRIKGVKELFLRAILVGEKLNIVNQERIHRPIKTLEVINGVELQSLHHVSNKPLRVQVHNFRIRVSATHRVTHRMHQVSFAKPNPAIQE